MSVQPASSPEKVTVRTLWKKKRAGQPITMITAYDYPSARAADRAGIDVILVGDSLGMVVLGYETTIPVTMDEMLHHARAVARGAHRALLVGDMPFLSYHTTPAEAVRNAGRFLQEAGMDAVKLEGGRERLDVIRAILDAGIPVLGHLGLQPQRVHQLGGFRAQARTAAAAQRLIEDALALQAAGVFAIVLESVPVEVARAVTRILDIPTIGIGAGPDCDGQVLVYHDVLGLNDGHVPRFVRQYANLNRIIHEALTRYRAEVEARTFPAEEHTLHMKPEEAAALDAWLRAHGFFRMRR
ncbi:MAG: 3-methyl-2-oxobutanoate hydroxymethyltransferase [Chloroflexi bacterium]|nr:3-methyl-2-oxobutanoate hydroxymethyltransferase [Chloroflexota bacterium]